MAFHRFQQNHTVYGPSVWNRSQPVAWNLLYSDTARGMADERAPVRVLKPSSDTCHHNWTNVKAKCEKKSITPMDLELVPSRV